MVGGVQFAAKRSDFIAEKAFGAALLSEPLNHLGRLEEIKNSPLSKHPIYQGSVPSCVVCAQTFVNMYESYFSSKNEVTLSWPYVYAQVPHYEGGTIPQDVLSFVKNNGQCEDSLYPQAKFWEEPFFAEDPRCIKQEAKDNAVRYKTSSYFIFQNTSLANLYPYLKTTPLFIGLSVDPNTWNTAGEKEVLFAPEFGGVPHVVALVDLDDSQNLQCISWGNKDGLDVKTLYKDTPILFAAMSIDLPDGVKKEALRRGIDYQVIKHFLQKYV